MEYSNDAKLLALVTAFRALVLSLHESGALQSDVFVRHMASARNRLVDLGHTECVDAFDSMSHPIAADLGFKPVLD